MMMLMMMMMIDDDVDDLQRPREQIQTLNGELGGGQMTIKGLGGFEWEEGRVVAVVGVAAGAASRSSSSRNRRREEGGAAM